MSAFIKRAVLCMCASVTLMCNVVVGEASQCERLYSDTVITRENIEKVCDYLNLDSSEIDWSENVDDSVSTVGELKKYIQDAKENFVIGENYSSNIRVDEQSCRVDLKAISAKTLSYTFDNDGYKYKVMVSAKYSGKKFKGVGSAKVSVSGGGVLSPISYKIFNDTLKASYTENKVNVNGNVWISAYVGIDKIGLVKIWTQKNTVNCNWYASDCL